MQISEEQVRRRLIERLLELGYPKSSIVLEVGISVGRNKNARIDLAVKDPDTNKVLAIFEVKRDISNMDSAVQQVISYSKILPDEVQAFIYSFNGELEEIFSVNPKKNDVSQVYDIPAYDSLKNADSSKNRESLRTSYTRAKNPAKAWSTIVAGMSSSLAAAIAIAMAAGLFFDEKKTLNNSELTEKIFYLEKEKSLLEGELRSLKTELSSIEKGLKSVSTIPEGHGWKTEASKISSDVSILSNKLTALESALTVDPAKALAVPILRKDLDNSEKALKAELLQTRAEIDRMYDQNKWFIGLMFTIALSVLGMAASSFFNRKDT